MYQNLTPYWEREGDPLLQLPPDKQLFITWVLSLTQPLCFQKAAVTATIYCWYFRKVSSVEVMIAILSRALGH